MKNAKTSDDLKNRFLKEMIKNLPEIPLALMRSYIEKPEDFQETLSNAFFIPHDFKIWKTIKINGNQDLKKMNRRMKKAGINTGSLVENFLKDVDFSKKGGRKNIVLLSVDDLGLNNYLQKMDGVSYEEICCRAKRLGLSLCSTEIALQLRLDYLNQPENEWIVIAMNPITISNEQKLLVLGSNKCGLWLNCMSYMKQDDFWFNKRKFAFVVNGFSSK